MNMSIQGPVADLVSICVAVTVTPGGTAPSSSVTQPLSWADACAKAQALARIRQPTLDDARRREQVIAFSSHDPPGYLGQVSHRERESDAAPIEVRAVYQVVVERVKRSASTACSECTSARSCACVTVSSR
jgi:hypothetical protein